MKIFTRDVLKDLDGNPLPKSPEDSSATTMGSILLQCVMSGPPPGGTPYTPAQHVDRFVLGSQIRKIEMDPSVEDGVEVDAKMVSNLIDDVCRLYHPMVAGQVVNKLNGKN